MTPILTYHSIGDSAPTGFAPFVVRPNRLRDQLLALMDTGYVSMTVSELIRRRRAGHPPAHAVILTFDDGFADFLPNVLPLLRTLRMTATLYVTTDLIGGRFHGLPMLTWRDLTEIQQGGVEIGGHTVSHPALDRLSAAAIQEEITASKHRLEDHLGTVVKSFAYPFGFYTPRVRQQVVSSGYTSACAVRYGFSPDNDDSYALKRIIVRNGSTRVDRLPAATTYYRSRSIAYAWMRRLLGGLK